MRQNMGLAHTPALSPGRGRIIRPRVADMNALDGRIASEKKSEVAPTATEIGKVRRVGGRSPSPRGRGAGWGRAFLL